jgi:hypothetical protein
MDLKKRQPLMQSHLPLILLGSAIALYGLLTALVGGWLSNQAMTGAITAGQYRSSLVAFDRTAGLLAGILFLALFIFSAVKTRGIVRAAFAIGSVSALSPVLATRAENLLFNVLGLPTMSAGSVLAGALTALIFALPLLIAFILLASGKRVPAGCRWLSFVSIFIVLAIAFYPTIVTVMAFLIKPGDPGVGQMMEISTTVIKLRYILLGIIFLLLAFLSLRFARKQQITGSSAGEINHLAQA